MISARSLCSRKAWSAEPPAIFCASIWRSSSASRANVGSMYAGVWSGTAGAPAAACCEEGAGVLQRLRRMGLAASSNAGAAAAGVGAAGTLASTALASPSAVPAFHRLRLRMGSADCAAPACDMGEMAAEVAPQASWHVTSASPASCSTSLIVVEAIERPMSSGSSSSVARADSCKPVILRLPSAGPSQDIAR